ncbi:MAG: DUF2802 domain-containing protein [Propionivibrio sp.]|uniref:DUF2802 domain-containing protein n=1 Tax=Propionivibrio sp. TaxID=2212460 RepID=UPI001A426457|nr:DUF2802 domain-containing protein [Propionivibrio sp.]MBL8416377.1 DUF2802 domain-containing protein [Propionivibrio sp.]
MDFEALGNLSWREALIAIIALLVLYLVLAFLRIRRLKREPAIEELPVPLAAHPALAAYAAEQAPEMPEPPSSSTSPADSPTLTEALAVPSEIPFPWNEPPPEIPGQQLIEALERDLAQLRKEVDVLRAEMLLLREAQRRDLAHSQVAQNASPLYNDAMQMAMQGLDAASIAQHCGIARAEAELVVALVRNRE